MNEPCQESPGTRLRAERERLKLSQKHCAASVDAGLSTWKRWEQGSPIPSDKMELLPELGFDVYYVLTGTRTVPAPEFFTESEGTSTDERLSEAQPRDETARFAASRLANEALKQAGVEAGIGLRAVLRDLVLWYGVPEETLAEVIAAVKEEVERAKRPE